MGVRREGAVSRWEGGGFRRPISTHAGAGTNLVGGGGGIITHQSRSAQFCSPIRERGRNPLQPSRHRAEGSGGDFSAPMR